MSGKGWRGRKEGVESEECAGEEGWAVKRAGLKGNELGIKEESWRWPQH